MQISTPQLLPTRTGPWTRQRHHWPTFKRVGEPLNALRGTEHDPWSFVDGQYIFTNNPVWEAAVTEYNRRYVLYMQKQSF